MSFPALSRDRVPGRPAPELPPPPRPAARHRDRAAPAGVRRVAGRYRYEVRRGSWWWSSEMFALHGVPADTAEITTEHMLVNLHPEDRGPVLAAVGAACAHGQPFALRARIVHPDGSHRTAVLVGEPEIAEDGEVTAVQGLSVDVPDRPRTRGAEDRTDALEAEVAQMRAAMASRATIEQAKGILMLLTSCSDAVAFELLAHISSHTHRKVRDVAESITESASGHARLPDDVAAIVRDACPPPAPRT